MTSGGNEKNLCSATQRRHNLGVLTKAIPVGKQAHHVIPQAVETQIKKYLPKLNINDPRFGAWVGGNHQKWSKAYQRDWERFLRQKRSLKEVKEFARQMGKTYGFKVNF